LDAFIRRGNGEDGYTLGDTIPASDDDIEAQVDAELSEYYPEPSLKVRVNEMQPGKSPWSWSVPKAKVFGKVLPFVHDGGAEGTISRAENNSCMEFSWGKGRV